MTEPTELTFRVAGQQQRKLIIISVLTFAVILGILLYPPVSAVLMAGPAGRPGGSSRGLNSP